MWSAFHRADERRARAASRNTPEKDATFARDTGVCVRACVCDMSGLHAHSRCYASAVLAMALCLSFTSQSSSKTAKRRITQTTPHDSAGTLVSDAKDIREIRPGSPPTRAPNAGGVGQNRRLSTNNQLYLESGTR